MPPSPTQHEAQRIAQRIIDDPVMSCQIPAYINKETLRRNLGLKTEAQMLAEHAMKTDVVTPTGTEAAVCAMIAERQVLGVAKYGKTVAENPLNLRQWLQHLLEEQLDAAIYTKRAIEEIDRQSREKAADILLNR